METAVPHVHWTNNIFLRAKSEHGGYYCVCCAASWPGAHKMRALEESLGAL